MAPNKKRPRAPAGRGGRSRDVHIKTPKRPQPLLAVPPPPVTTDVRPALTIAGIGASAGGLESFSTLLKALPARPGVALVFVQHLAPQHESALVPLLSGQTPLPVVQTTQGLDVEPNKVYVIPPNTQMVIAGRSLHLSARPDDRSQYTPIDAFFSSLAESAGASA